MVRNDKLEDRGIVFVRSGQFHLKKRGGNTDRALFGERPVRVLSAVVPRNRNVDLNGNVALFIHAVLKIDANKSIIPIHDHNIN